MVLFQCIVWVIVMNSVCFVHFSKHTSFYTLDCRWLESIVLCLSYSVTQQFYMNENNDKISCDLTHICLVLACDHSLLDKTTILVDQSSSWSDLPFIFYCFSVLLHVFLDLCRIIIPLPKR